MASTKDSLEYSEVGEARRRYQCAPPLPSAFPPLAGEIIRLLVHVHALETPNCCDVGDDNDGDQCDDGVFDWGQLVRA